MKLISDPSLSDLPPKWDGQPVQWRDWSAVGGVFVCTSAPEPWCACGNTGTVQMCSGLMQQPDGSWLVALTAQRCGTCGADTVTEVDQNGPIGAGAVWTLEWPTDYGPDGSVA